MTLKEADRLAVMKQLDNKKINLRKASKELGISYRQQIRIWQNYQREGPKGLISKRIGKPGNYRLSNELIQKVLSLIKEKYLDYGPTLACEKLEEKWIGPNEPQIQKIMKKTALLKKAVFPGNFQKTIKSIKKSVLKHTAN